MKIVGPEQRPPTERERMLIKLRLNSPHRAQTGKVLSAQADAGHLPLFIAADEPRLI